MIRTSVIVPTHDRAPLLGAALDSVLAQCGGGDEVIVVDDSSTDETAAVLGRYAGRVAVLRQPRAGPAAARNRGLAAARGAYLAFLDSDDLWDGCHQRVLHGLLDADGGAALAFGRVREFAVGPAGGREIRRSPGACCGALLARRSAFAALGPFRADLRAGEFIDWMARARRRGLREARSDAVVLHRRAHPGNMTRRPGVLADYAAVLRAHLAAGGGGR